ncbi:MAG: trehalase family glycosidase [Vicinamibacteria bacterium]
MNRRVLLAAALALAPGALAPAVPAPDRAPAAVEARLLAYVEQAWGTLTRSRRDLLAAARDEKVEAPAGGRWPVYVSAKEDRAAIERELRLSVPTSDLAQIELRTLPADTKSLRRHGLLYVPKPYVVPGGRFNELYGWDTYFILRGLLEAGRVEAARDLVDNHVYEVEHYGTVLNANRSYYLTRSQPPFLGRMILEVHDRTRDDGWLARVRGALTAYHAYWTREPHLVPGLGLSRYHDSGQGPAPEVLVHERDAQGRTHYDRALEYYRTHEVTAYDLRLFYDRKAGRLTPLFFEGDRAMRESGFDPSFRFGPFSVDIVHHAPVCLNSLLFQLERDAAELARRLGDAAGAREWNAKAEARGERIGRLLWNDEKGLFLDWNFRRSRPSDYAFATTFFPLWTGAASPAQAERVRRNLAVFEAPGGVLTSPRVSGSQWDAPFGWAPLQLVAVEGLRRYGFHADADRLARRFLSLVAKEFDEHGTIVEKYDLCRRESDVAQGLRFGYSSNEIGFGWTNGAFLVLRRQLVERGVALSAGDESQTAACAALSSK